MKPRTDHSPDETTLPRWQVNLITSICNSVTNNYVFAESIKQADLNKKLNEYFLRINSEFPAADKKIFCAEVNKALKDIDPHLILQYDPSQIEDHLEHGRVKEDPRKNGCSQFQLQGLDPPQSWYEKFKKENYGFDVTPPTAIPDAIGYIKINDFLDPGDGLGKLAKEKALEILSNMQEKQAIVIDLRDSHGGSPEMVEFIISYLLTENEKAKIENGVYNSIYDYSIEKSKDYHVSPTKFNLNVPICILTNNQTFSAAEEFAYDLQQINKHLLNDNRFVIMGQATRGGAHAMTGFPLVNPDKTVNQEYFLWVPTKTTINPYTLTNWEDGRKKEGAKPGVQPDSGFVIPENKDTLAVAVTYLTSRPKLAPSHDAKISTPTLSTTAKTSVFLGIPSSAIIPSKSEHGIKKENSESVTNITVSPAPTVKATNLADNSPSTNHKSPNSYKK